MQQGNAQKHAPMFPTSLDIASMIVPVPKIYQNLFTASNPDISQDLEGLIPYSLNEEDLTILTSLPSLT